MAKPPKPPAPKKGRPPSPGATRGNLKQPSPTTLVDLNFKVEHQFKRRMRQFALNHNMKVKDLLIAAFDDYERKHGRTVGGDLN